MARYGMVIDIKKCNGCYNCFLACRDEYEGNDYPPYSAAQPSTGKSWMRISERERGSCPKVKVDYVPLPCFQCSEASCVQASSNGTVYQRPDGIVLIDPEKGAGQREIIATCPHRVIYWNETKNIPQKCTFCAHLLDQGWKEPRCVEACPSGALIFGDLDDPDSDISTLIASGKTEELHPEYGLKPNVFYIGLPKPFIAGEVLLEDQQDECAEGISVTLSCEGETQSSRTNNFGDFEFNGLEPNRSYTILIRHDGYREKELSVRTNRDVNLGEIILEPEV
jgi:Fe-S-cluster-containing dehydrogenase component